MGSGSSFKAFAFASAFAAILAEPRIGQMFFLYAFPMEPLDIAVLVLAFDHKSEGRPTTVTVTGLGSKEFLL